MKTKGILLMCGLMSFSVSAISQKTSQAELPNEVYAGYGAGSVFYFTRVSQAHNGMSSSSHDYLQSAGTFFLGYTRNFNRVVSMGVLFSYMPSSTDLTSNYIYENNGYGSSTTGSATDDLLGAITRITFSYVNKPVFRIYSGVAIGVTVDLGKTTINGQTDKTRKLIPAGQLTMFGVRFGRALGGFIEMGIGTQGIINAGITYKIRD
jgi:hypothetical protein